MRTTQTEIRNFVKFGKALDITHYTMEEIDNIQKAGNILETIAYSWGVYGCNGRVYRGRTDGKLYAITCRATSLFCIGY